LILERERDFESELLMKKIIILVAGLNTVENSREKTSLATARE
tara:strand:- start:95 stop:223 length:129 start_codon:yes stop_codon:yes gene_type:complete